MSRTYRGYQKRDGKRVGKPPRSYKVMKERMRRAGWEQDMREGRELAIRKNCNHYDYN